MAMVHLNMEEIEKQAKRLQQNMLSLRDDAMQRTDDAKKYLEGRTDEAKKYLGERTDDAKKYIEERTDDAKKYLEDKAEETLKEVRARVNQELSKFAQIQLMVLQPIPFEKTPTHKIKRFLYT